MHPISHLPCSERGLVNLYIIRPDPIIIRQVRVVRLIIAG